MAEIRCPSCHVRIRYSSEKDVRHIRCPKCSEPIDVSSRPTVADDAPPRAGRTAESAASPGRYIPTAGRTRSRMYSPPKRKTPLAPIIAITAVSVVGIIAGLVAILHLSNRPDEQVSQSAPPTEPARPRASVDSPPLITRGDRANRPARPSPTPAELTLKKDDRLKINAIRLEPNVYSQADENGVGSVVALASNQSRQTITKAVIEFYFRQAEGGYLKTMPIEARYIPPLGDVHLSHGYSGIDAADVQPDYQVIKVVTDEHMVCFEAELHYDMEQKRVGGWVRNPTTRAVGNPALIVDFLGPQGRILDSLMLTDLGEKFPSVLDAGARGFIDAPAHPRSYVATGQVSCRLFDKPRDRD